jgi:thioredoxin reductase (NADPH)
MRVRRWRDIWDVAVVGGGIAGLTGAWHAMRRGLATILFEGEAAHGGLVANVNHLDDWPAPGETSGVELAASLVATLRDEGAELVNERVERVTIEGALARVTAGSHEVRARSVLVASGAKPKALGVPGEESLRGKGVSQCADCDGYFFRNQDVVVVGGGDAALQEALELLPICRSVSIVARSALKARAAYVERVASAANARFVWDSMVVAVLGEGGVAGVRIRNVKTGGTSEIACTGVFPFVGAAPDTAFLPAAVARDERGGVVTDARLQASVPQIYAVGAARAGYGGDLVQAAGDAAAAVGALARDLAL